MTGFQCISKKVALKTLVILRGETGSMWL
jgi:hypothetical protein